MFTKKSASPTKGENTMKDVDDTVPKASPKAPAGDKTKFSGVQKKGVTKAAGPAKTAAGGAKLAFKDGGSVKMPKMCSTM